MQTIATIANITNKCTQTSPSRKFHSLVRWDVVVDVDVLTQIELISTILFLPFNAQYLCLDNDDDDDDDQHHHHIASGFVIHAS